MSTTSTPPGPRTRTRRPRPHIWTPFEQHTLLCLLCRQIQLTGAIPSSPSSTSANIHTGTTTPRRRRGGGRTHLVSNRQHAYADVADLLNRSLNYDDHAKDIPAREVAAMVDRLMEERKGAVRFLERQGVGRVTRAVKRVWERAGLEGERGEGVGEVVVDGVRGQAVGLVDNAHGDNEDDPWGDNVVTHPTLDQADPWGDDVMVSSANFEAANVVKSGDNFDTPMTNAQDVTDPWGSNKSTLVNSSDRNDPWGSYTPTDTVERVSSADLWASSQRTAGFNTINSDDPWASLDPADAPHITAINSNDLWGEKDTSTAFVSTAKRDTISSAAEAVTSTQAKEVSTAVTALHSAPQQQQSFTGINSERLAMLNAKDVNEDIQEDIILKPTQVSRGKGENAVELPFNRLAKLNSKSKSGN